ncbi:short-chain dehydrogenase [Rhizobium sp. ACO-34A]|nr:NnrS family protein [Rhizobium sp. ACO-34A]ATN36084.1 short-chain dehydrogenase [Rhizobium sp. ACO-34A]
MNTSQQTSRPAGGIPRGLSKTGPVLFSYGFRPFFLGAAIVAMAAMILWIAALAGLVDVGGSYSAHHWHAHEMLFGFSSAVVAGFLLTAVPNWTGRLPVSGRPLAGLFALWVAGRLLMLWPDLTGLVPSVAIESLFLPVLLFICAREIIAGRKWKDLKVLGVLAVLSLANIGFHLDTLAGEHGGMVERLAVSAYLVLIMIIGGRIIPSFSRNWLNQKGETRFPVSYGRFDTVVIVIGALALACWSFRPDEPATLALAAVAGIAHAARLRRWRGLAVWPEKLLFILHVAYAFLPLGFAAIALGDRIGLGDTAIMHVMTVGAMAAMMLAVMTRATRGHTGRQLTSSRLTNASYVAILMAAILRPLADILPDQAMTLYSLAGLAWLTAFGLFLTEYGPMLARVRRG